MAPLGDITPATFLRDYWQKKPLLIRGAFPDFDAPLDGDELAGLACDPDVESRIIVTEPGPNYLLREGPFTADDFAEAEAQPWTLLVQDVDKHLPEFAHFLDAFAFLPEWRLEDLMVSWASDGGSVGPHTDQYDVFLLQARGQRRWTVGVDEANEWVLKPGDMLYLPPGVPHWGVAVGECMTWSIGLRAPSVREMVTDFAERIGETIPETNRYRDPDTTEAEAADGRLSDAAIKRAADLLEAAHAAGRAQFPRWFGELVTAPKAWLHCVPPALPLSREALADALRAGTTLIRDPRSRLVWLPVDGALCLCVDGDSFETEPRLQPLVTLLCTQREFSQDTLAGYLDDDQAMALLVRLYTGGQLMELDDE